MATRAGRQLRHVRGTGMIYQFKEGARVPAGADAERVGARLAKIAKRAGGLTATVLTDEAQANPGDNVLGPWVEGDSELCVREFHEQQARALIPPRLEVQLVP